jgi:hypothetical protein
MKRPCGFLGEKLASGLQGRKTPIFLGGGGLAIFGMWRLLGLILGALAGKLD